MAWADIVLNRYPFFIPRWFIKAKKEHWSEEQIVLRIREHLGDSQEEAETLCQFLLGEYSKV